MRLKTLPFVMLFTVLILTIATFAFERYFSTILEEQFEERLYRLADDLLVEIAHEPDVFLAKPKKFLKLPNSNEFSASSVLVQIDNPQGKILARSPGLEVEHLSLTAGEDNLWKDITFADGARLKIYQRQIIVDGQELGYLLVGSSANQLVRTLKLFRMILLVIMGGTILIMLIGLNALAAQDIARLQKQFLSFASHELKIPLAVISGNAELALRGKLSEKQYRQTIATIQKESNWMQKIVRDLLQISRNEMGTEKPNKIKFDLSELVLSETEALSKRWPAKSLKVQLKTKGYVLADMDQLKKVVSNLLENAALYTAPKGKITVSLWEKNKKIYLAVTDNGIGIPKEKQKDIFKPFFRVNKQNNANGLGLGLAIVKYFVELNHGTILLASNLGKGSTFTVVLPIPRL